MVVRIKCYLLTNRQTQPFSAKMSCYQRRASTDLLLTSFSTKHVTSPRRGPNRPLLVQKTSPTRGPNRPFRCLNLLSISIITGCPKKHTFRIAINWHQLVNSWPPDQCDQRMLTDGNSESAFFWDTL